ncbi:MAG: hypothetical protein CMJ78_22890 [Planctomycetaceae bacterium]|nr:hypothetical protein [Planctomycetaceae bacterium]
MIRTLEIDDCPKLKGLHVDVWGLPPKGWSQLVEQYDQLFPRLFLEHPWCDSPIKPLVSDASGRVNGLVGLMPRPLSFKQQQITMAVTTQFCVARRDRGKMVAVQLMHKALKGSQDLTIADESDGDTARFMMALGAHRIPAFEITWFRPLQPIATIAAFAARLPKLGWSHPLTRSLSSRLDRLTGLLNRWPFDVNDSPLSAIPLTPEIVLDRFNAFTSDRTLRPVYNSENIDWIWQRTSCLSENEMRRNAVVDDNGEVVGWYIYEVAKSGIGQVFQFIAKPESASDVLGQLLADAKSQGLAAITGRVDSLNVPEFASHRGLIHQSTSQFLAHSRNPEILETLQRGDAHLSVVEGERSLDLGMRSDELPPATAKAYTKAAESA